jgi:hypothetical protein
VRSSDRLIAGSGADRDPEGMTALDPQVTGALCTTFAASLMIVLGRSKGMLEVRKPERCAACSRLVEPGRRCSHCG